MKCQQKLIRQLLSAPRRVNGLVNNGKTPLLYLLFASAVYANEGIDNLKRDLEAKYVLHAEGVGPKSDNPLPWVSLA